MDSDTYGRSGTDGDGQSQYQSSDMDGDNQALGFMLAHNINSTGILF